MRFAVLATGALALVALPGPGIAQHDIPIPSCIASTLDGYVITRLLPPEAKGPQAGQLRAVVRRAVAWLPGETVKVCFRSGTDTARQRVARYAREWMEHASIAFDFGEGNGLRTCQSDGRNDIKIDFVDNRGWTSALGTMARQRETSMNLAYFGTDAPVYPDGRAIPEANIRRVVLHEFGHALGLMHEHQSPKSDCDSEFDWEKAYEAGARIGWDKAKVDHNYRQLINAEEYNLTDVDRKSIMHYSLPPEVFKLGVRSPCWVAHNFDLSEQDRSFVRTIYPKKDDPVVVSSAPETTTTRAAQRRTAEREALVKDYERLLRQAGVASDKAGQLTAEFRRLALGR